MYDLPAHLDCWIASDPDDGRSVVTGVADDHVVTLQFRDAIGYRPGERDLEMQHIVQLVESAPQLMQELRYMVNALRTGTSRMVDLSRALALLQRLDELDPTQDPRFPPLTYAQRMDMADTK